jgi:translation elongation factor EF-Ts
VPQNPHEEELVEPLTEKIKDIVANMPNENEEAIEELLKEIIPSKETSKNDLEEFAASYTENPVFERKQKMEVEEKPKSINDNINSGLQIGLNDRIAFIKQLFNNSTDDYLKVLSQINSMDTFEEAQIFIQSKVRLDYNWAEKETYVDRFLLIIEKSFN